MFLLLLFPSPSLSTCWNDLNSTGFYCDWQPWAAWLFWLFILAVFVGIFVLIFCCLMKVRERLR